MLSEREIPVVCCSALSSHQYKPISISGFLSAWIKRKRGENNIHFHMEKIRQNNNKTKKHFKRGKKKSTWVFLKIFRSPSCSAFMTSSSPFTQTPKLAGLPRRAERCGPAFCLLPQLVRSSGLLQNGNEAGASAAQPSPAAPGRGTPIKHRKPSSNSIELIRSAIIFRSVVMFKHKHAYLCA